MPHPDTLLGMFSTVPVNVGEPRVFLDPMVDIGILETFGYGSSTGRLQYWTLYRRVDDGTITVTFRLSKPAVGGEELEWDILEDLDGAEGTYLQTITTPSKTVTLSAAQETVTVTLTPVDSAGWFKERWIEVGFTGGTGLRMDSKVNSVSICLYPSVEPPLIALAADSTDVENDGDEVDLVYALSAACDDDVTLRAQAAGALADHFTESPAVIPAGNVVGTLTMTYDGGGTATEQCTFDAWYEPNVEDYSDNRFDPDAVTWTGPANKVYEQENQLRTSNAHNAQGLYQNIKAGAVRLHPGRPSNKASGSIALDPSRGAFLYYDVQDAATPIIEPFFGTDIRLTRNPRISLGDPSDGDNGTIGLAYWRDEFDSQFAGGEEAFHSAKNYYMTGICISEFAGDETAGREWPFHRVGCRVRSKNRNHGVIFATNRDTALFNGTPGTNRWGDTGMPVWIVDGVSYWLWDVARLGSSQGSQSSCHPNSTARFDADGTGTNDATKGDYGVVDLTAYGLGAFLWFKHHIDGTAIYDIGNDQTGGGDHTHETADVDDLNSILYPWWLSDDGTNPETVEVSHTARRGVLAHSPWGHSSDSDISVPSYPWPCEGSMHTPWGNALLDPTTATHTATAI